MNILHISIGRPKDGASNGVLRSIHMLSQQQQKIGHNVRCLYFTRKQSASELAREIDEGFHTTLKSFAEISSIFKRSSPSRIYFHGGGHWRFWILFVILLILQNGKHTLVFTPRGAYSRGAVARRSIFKNSLLKIIEVKLVLRVCSHIQALNANEASDISDFLRRADAPINIVSNAIADIQYVYERSSVNKHTNIVFCGRLDVYGKGIDLLLDMMSLDEPGNSNWRLTLIGPYASEADKKYIGDAIARGNLNVELCGQMFGVEKWSKILEGDIFILPSRSEGSPTGLLEVASTGMPCVASSETNLSQDDFNSGIKQCELSAESLLNCIKSHLNDIHDDSNRQRHRFINTYSIENVAYQHDILFN